MKNQIKKIILFSIFVFITIIACSDNDNLDTTPPGKLSNITVTPINGGGIINYNLPSDNDILYVKAVYTNSLGDEVYRVSSKHNTSLEVNGLNQTSPLKVKLFVIDESQNISESTEIEFTPLKSFIFLVQESIQITPDLGGVKITWDNIASKTVFVYVHILDNGNETVRILSSDSPQESIFVRGLEAKELTFSTRV